jgi:hypothetical protein
MPRAVERHDVEHLLGPIADHGLARILATGGTPDELVEAYERLTQEDGVIVRHPGTAAGRVLELMDAIAEVWDEDEDEEDADQQRPA